jgi:hypothetical protein
VWSVDRLLVLSLLSTATYTNLSKLLSTLTPYINEIIMDIDVVNQLLIGYSVIIGY